MYLLYWARDKPRGADGGGGAGLGGGVGPESRPGARPRRGPAWARGGPAPRAASASCASGRGWARSPASAAAHGPSRRRRAAHAPAGGPRRPARQWTGGCRADGWRPGARRAQDRERAGVGRGHLGGSRRPATSLRRERVLRSATAILPLPPPAGTSWSCCGVQRQGN